MLCAVAQMIQLSYQAALDPFHTMYRDLRILNAIGPSHPLFVDHMRVLDFYLLFPFKISAIRLMPQHRKFRGLADDYENVRPYGNLPDNTQIFARMEPIQIAALESLAEKEIIDAAELKNGNVIRTQISLPPALDARVSDANAREPKLMEAISALGSEYTHPIGLQNRITREEAEARHAEGTVYLVGHYDGEGRLTRAVKFLRGEVFFEYLYIWHPNGRLRCARVSRGGRVTVLEYDARGRRVSEASIAF
jgi:hypothetical protein